MKERSMQTEGLLLKRATKQMAGETASRYRVVLPHWVHYSSHWALHTAPVLLHACEQRICTNSAPGRRLALRRNAVQLLQIGSEVRQDWD